MLNIRIICVGKFKEKYWEAASAEYMKRLGAYCNVSVIEVKEEKLPAHASRADEENVIIKEGKSILDKIEAGDYVIALDIFAFRFIHRASREDEAFANVNWGRMFRRY